MEETPEISPWERGLEELDMSVVDPGASSEMTQSDGKLRLYAYILYTTNFVTIEKISKVNKS